RAQGFLLLVQEVHRERRHRPRINARSQKWNAVSRKRRSTWHTVSWKRCAQYVVHPKQMKVDGDRVFLPLYMAHML
ncbi:MAG: hypothetical protein Q4A07_13320, partial [Coriobacteriales bacterium]|nr:hypothetical protein [Coriobacteriales bacterium]